MYTDYGNKNIHFGGVGYPCNKCHSKCGKMLLGNTKYLKARKLPAYWPTKGFACASGELATVKWPQCQEKHVSSKARHLMGSRPYSSREVGFSASAPKAKFLVEEDECECEDVAHAILNDVSRK